MNFIIIICVASCGARLSLSDMFHQCCCSSFTLSRWTLVEILSPGSSGLLHDHNRLVILKEGLLSGLQTMIRWSPRKALYKSNILLHVNGASCCHVADLSECVCGDGWFNLYTLMA